MGCCSDFCVVGVELKEGILESFSDFLFFMFVCDEFVFLSFEGGSEVVLVGVLMCCCIWFIGWGSGVKWCFLFVSGILVGL